MAALELQAGRTLSQLIIHLEARMPCTALYGIPPGKKNCLFFVYSGLPKGHVKYEDVYIKGYQIPADAQAGLGEYFPFYNDRRYHQALAYKTPHEVHYGSAERN